LENGRTYYRDNDGNIILTWRNGEILYLSNDDGEAVSLRVRATGLGLNAEPTRFTFHWAQQEGITLYMSGLSFGTTAANKFPVLTWNMQSGIIFSKKQFNFDSGIVSSNNLSFSYTQPPNGTISFAHSGAGNVSSETSYVVTYLTAFGETTINNETSVDEFISEKVFVSNIPTGDSSVTGRRIYRLAPDGNYRLVGTISNRTDTTYMDNTGNSFLGEIMPTWNTAGGTIYNNSYASPRWLLRPNNTTQDLVSNNNKSLMSLVSNDSLFIGDSTGNSVLGFVVKPSGGSNESRFAFNWGAQNQLTLRQGYATVGTVEKRMFEWNKDSGTLNFNAGISVGNFNSTGVGVAYNPALISGILSNATSLTFGEVLAQSSKDLGMSLNGCAPGDSVLLGIPTGAITNPNGSQMNNCGYFAWVSGHNTISIRLNNHGTTPVTGRIGLFRATVYKI
jgi:hypothetical protein